MTTAMEGLRRLATGFGFVGAVGYLGMKVRKAHARVCNECSTAELLASVSYRHIMLIGCASSRFFLFMSLHDVWQRSEPCMCVQP
jgi:hypothetical protein